MTTTTAPSIRYRIKRGDTLTRLAERFGVSILDIVSANHLANPDNLTEGRTLVIPPAPPLTLTVTPAQGAPGDTFHFLLNGGRPGETITFTITSPAGTYTGAPHIASPRGVVDATYNSDFGARTGRYTVVARGSRGATRRTTFTVTAPPTTGT